MVTGPLAPDPPTNPHLPIRFLHPPTRPPTSSGPAGKAHQPRYSGGGGPPRARVYESDDEWTTDDDYTDISEEDDRWERERVSLVYSYSWAG